MPSLTDAYARLKRADEHLQGVYDLADAICTAQEKATVVEVMPEQSIASSEPTQVLAVESANTPIDGRLAVLVGDAVNSLRSCLDYLIGELSELDSGERKPRTQFPIEVSAQAFQGQMKKYLNGVNDEHSAYIERLQPYSGTEWAAKLARMSNLDKHNRLVVVAHDYLLGAAVTTHALAASGEVGLELKVTLRPSLRIEFEDGFQLVEALREIREGVSVTLDHFLSEFSAA